MLPRTSSHPRAASASDEIELRQLAHILWQYRRSIIALALLGAALGVAISLMQTRYRSEGLFLTPGLTMANYKPYEAAMVNKHRLARFLELSVEADGPAGELMRGLIDDPESIRRAIQPAFSFTDKDAKQFGVKAGDTDIVGVRLLFEATEPSGATAIRFLGEYVRDTKIMLDMEGRAMDTCLSNDVRAQELRNAQIVDQFEISQREARAQTLRDIIRRHPQAAQVDSRQVVSLESGGERFLSPTAQLIAVEVAISDLKLADNARARERIATEIRREYYCQARDLLQEPITGRAFLKELERVQEAILAKQDASSEVVELVGNGLAIERANWVSAYLAGMRFVTSPEGAELRVRKPGLPLGLVLGGLLGGLFGIILAFLRGWWRENRAVVVAED